jgi:hypothetical protein
MEKLFNQFKGLKIVHNNYTGVICGYNAANFILAIESKDDKFFRKLPKDTFILEEYKDVKFRYYLEDERACIKQLKNDSKC